MIPATNLVPSTITSFAGSKIEGSIGKNGVFAAFDWESMILPPASSLAHTQKSEGECE
jgi:hypothetical protein